MFHYRTSFVIVCLLAKCIWSKDNDNDSIEKMQNDFIVEGVNKSVNACDDWPKFSCASSSMDGFQDSFVSKMRSRTLSDFLKALKSIDVNDNAIPKFKIWLRTFYDQCLNDNSTDIDKAEQIFKGVSRILGGTPPLLAKDREEKDKIIRANVWHMLGRFNRELILGPIFDTTVISIPWTCNNTRKVLALYPPVSLLMSTEMNVTKAIKYTKKYAENHNIRLDERELNETVQNMKRFEDDLKNILNSTLDEIPNDNILTLAQLKSINPNIEWNEFFDGLLTRDQLRVWNQTEARFIVDKQGYFKRLDKILTKYGPETIFDYVFWTTVEDNYRLAVVKDEVEVEENNSNKCLGVINTLQSSAAVRVLFDFNKWDLSEWSRDINLIVQTLISAFKFLITTADWLDNENKISMISKLNYMTINDGIPDWILNDEKVQRRTIKFDPFKGTYDNLLNLQSNLNILSYDQMISNKEEDDEPSLDATTGYTNLGLSIGLGAAVPPFYHPKYPLAMKYGYLGTLIARQLSRIAVETNWDESVPNLRRESLYTKPIRETYRKRRDCIVPQLKINCHSSESNCTLPEQVTETMMSLDGLQIAYTAYKFASQLTEERTKSSTKIDDFNQDEIFFIAANRYLCTVDVSRFWFFYNIDESGKMWSNRVQSEAPFMNIPAFAKAFQCNYSSDHHCGIWSP